MSSDSEDGEVIVFQGLDQLPLPPQNDSGSQDGGSLDAAKAAVAICAAPKPELEEAALQTANEDYNVAVQVEAAPPAPGRAPVPQATPSWWDRHFRLLQESGHSVLDVKLKDIGLDTQDVSQVLCALTAFVARMCPEQSTPIVVDIDFSQNRLDDTSCAMIIRWISDVCAKHPSGSRLRIFKCFKNRASETACDLLARLLLAQEAPVDEIHLSHNEIGQLGFVTLLAALALHPHQAYPKQRGRTGVPCWLRLEHNDVEDVEDLLAAMGKAPIHLRVCDAPRSSSKESCTPAHCCKAPALPAHAHLFCVFSQRQSDSPAGEKPEKLARKLHTAITGGKLRLPGPCLKHVGQVELKCPASVAPCRTATLHLDSNRRAGLELVASSHGMLVEGVETEPGQELAEGDVILAIDGVQLWGGLGQDETDEAFGGCFRDGARLRVASFAAVEGRALCIPVPGVSRSEALLNSLRADLAILGKRCGLHSVQLQDSAGWVVLVGSPAAQRHGVAELSQLLPFYLPHLSASHGELPECHWIGDRDPHCEHVDAYEEETDTGLENLGGENVGDLSAWESSLRRQWGEDDNLDDPDLPWEPLEAPDDGPDVFEGEIALPSHIRFSPLRVLMLMGLPGSGKSTVATRLQESGQWHRVNQDVLGDRRSCVMTAKKVLSEGGRVVIDRCNVSRLQRSVWLALAQDFDCSVGCLWLDVDAMECGRRVLARFGHETLPAEKSSLDVIQGFGDRLEQPLEAEGFLLWCVADSDPHQLGAALRDIEGLSEQLGAPGHDDRGAHWGDAPDTSLERFPDGDFRYNWERAPMEGRSARVQFLRAVRRQVEYYFSDPNLRQDWFFHEKINEGPHEGWLELRWILSCPRIKGVYEATDEDILEALGPSTLMVEEREGTHWVRRGRPLPALEKGRPAKGDEPDWYKKLSHAPRAARKKQKIIEKTLEKAATKAEKKVNEKTLEKAAAKAEKKAAKAEKGTAQTVGLAADEATFMCAECQESLPRAAFTKAQLTKYRSAPTCKACVALRT